MSAASALLFGWAQRSAAYASLHQEAVDLVGPANDGATWLDVGCGPGLVARLAADRRYDVLGVDRDAAMIRAARRSGSRPGLRFERAALGDDLPPADVVSAASLLCQLPDPAAGVEALWRLVRPGGTLLLVETTAAMSRATAVAAAPQRDVRSRRVLSRWGAAREGAAVPVAAFDLLPADHAVVPLLGGTVVARVARR